MTRAPAAAATAAQAAPHKQRACTQGIAAQSEVREVFSLFCQTIPGHSLVCTHVTQGGGGVCTRFRNDGFRIRRVPCHSGLFRVKQKTWFGNALAPSKAGLRGF